METYILKVSKTQKKGQAPEWRYFLNNEEITNFYLANRKLTGASCGKSNGIFYFENDTETRDFRRKDAVVYAAIKGICEATMTAAQVTAIIKGNVETVNRLFDEKYPPVTEVSSVEIHVDI